MLTSHWCIGKQGHKSEGAALAAIRSMLRREMPGAEALRPYKCVRCFRWHVGNADPRRALADTLPERMSADEYTIREEDP